MFYTLLVKKSSFREEEFIFIFWFSTLMVVSILQFSFHLKDKSPHGEGKLPHKVYIFLDPSCLQLSLLSTLPSIKWNWGIYRRKTIHIKVYCIFYVSLIDTSVSFIDYAVPLRRKETSKAFSSVHSISSIHHRSTLNYYMQNKKRSRPYGEGLHIIRPSIFKALSTFYFTCK